MSVLITGGRGQLGSDLTALLGDTAVPLAHADLDITDAAAIESAFAEHEPATVINCAAFHVVDAMEGEEEKAYEVNVSAVRALAKASAARGAKFVHFSSNYVFEGDRLEPYGEDDLPAPRSVYAISKLAGEHAALAYAPGAIVI
nr:NAD(P)-dependent oxidoreductase [Thermoleophilaceae bacterium]